jgi:hypothetical protein
MEDQAAPLRVCVFQHATEHGGVKVPPVISMRVKPGACRVFPDQDIDAVQLEGQRGSQSAHGGCYEQLHCRMVGNRVCGLHEPVALPGTIKRVS